MIKDKGDSRSLKTQDESERKNVIADFRFRGIYYTEREETGFL